MKEYILAVQRMQDYIEQNLTDNIKLSDLAEVSLFSPWYSYRLFRDCLGLTPAEYIRKCRLTQAAEQLRDGNTKVLDAGLNAGFANADTFTRAFFREFGLNPAEYMRHNVPVKFFIPYGAKYRELRKENIDMSNIQPVFVQVVRKPERICIIKRGKNAKDYFPYCEEVSCDVWGVLMSMKSLCGEPVSMWLPLKYVKPGTSVYVQGVEVEPDYAGIIPDGFDTVHLPECEYLMFQGQPFCEENYCEAIRAVQLAMDIYDPSAAGYCWDDENPRIQLEPRGQRGYIELRAVKRIQG